MVSCLVSELRFHWRLEPTNPGTRITVEVEIPERESSQLETQRKSIASSLARLSELAATA